MACYAVWVDQCARNISACYEPNFWVQPQQVCVYIDDILIFSQSEVEQFQHLEMVLQLLRVRKLFEKMKKCEIFKSELKYLGHVVSGSRVKPDPVKVETISQCPTPPSVHEVRQFLGLANYFRKLIRGYGATASPFNGIA